MGRRCQVVPLESLVLFRGESIRQVVVNQVIFGAAHSIQDVRTFQIALDRSRSSSVNPPRRYRRS